MIESLNSTLSTTDEGCVILGTIVTCLAIVGLIANILVGWTIISQGFLSASYPTIYRAILSLLICDSGQLINFGYIGVASAAQDGFIPKSLFWLPGFLILWMWHEMWLSLWIIVINR